MATYLALLRVVNVGGRKPIGMSELRELATRLKLDDARTLLQTGNLVFRSRARPSADLERLLESEAAARLGLNTDVIVRSAADWHGIIEGNPFAREAEHDPSHLVVMVFKAVPKPAAVNALRAAITGRDVVEAVGAHAYLVYPDGIGRSRLTTTLIEKTLGTRGSARNWNTAMKLAALMAS